MSKSGETRNDNRDISSLNWLITGGCGFIGRSMIAHLLEQGVPAGRVRILDNLSVGTPEDLSGVVAFAKGAGEWGSGNAPCSLVEGDIRSAETVAVAAKGADVVVHLAACTGVQPSVDDPMFDCETNVVGTLNCLEAARHGGASRFILASSGAPLGDVKPPIREDMVARPISPYGASKLAGEAYCSAYFACFGLDTVALRFGNVYGPLSSRKNSIVAKFIRQALAGETLEIYGDGSATRDYIFCNDLTHAIIQAATRENVGGEVFQIATSRETTVSELTDELLRVLEAHGIKDVKVVHGEPRRGDMLRNYSDTTKARETLGWTARVTLNEGLRRTVSWFLEQN